MTGPGAPDPAEAKDGPTPADRRRDTYIQLPHWLEDDPRYGRIYHSDLALATYIRMHMIADRMWPSAGVIPRGIKAKAMGPLVEAELITVAGHDRYRVPAVEDLRARRKAAGHAGGQASVTSRRDRSTDSANDPTDRG